MRVDLHGISDANMEIACSLDFQRNVKVKYIISIIFLNALYTCDSLHYNFVSSNVQQLVPSICLTPGCFKAAAGVKWNLDETVDPCDDFYRFACGGWLDRQTISYDKFHVSAFSELQDDLNLKLKVMMEKELTGSEPEFIKMIKLTYDSCMDLESIEKSDSDPLKKVLEDLGGWPVVEGSKWNESNFDWIDILEPFRKLGYSTDMLMTLSVEVDNRNNTAHIIKLDETSLGMSDRTYLLRGPTDLSTFAYFDRMVESAMLLGADEVTAFNEMLNALYFETLLAYFSLPKEEKRNMSKLYNKYTVATLQKEVPQIPWLKYFNSLLNDKVQENDSLIVPVPEFIRKFADLITVIDKRVVANYMLWRVVDQSLPTLSKKWRDLGPKGNDMAERWKQCLYFLGHNLEIALSSYYVRHYFKEENKDTASELVKYIRRQISNTLDEIDWMDNETKLQAKAKFDAIKMHIGYPTELLNDTVVLELYENLTITNDTFFENVMRIRKWNKDYKFSQLRKPNIKEEWRKYANVALVNAFYFPEENSIQIPAGILQNPFFNADRPQYMNFGAIGFIIGHEIIHGFDDIGRQFDKDGNNVNWWHETTDELFNKKAQCIIDQYSNYTDENGMKLNGILTQGENIADIGGLKETYWAYHSWVEDHGKEQKLPGLKFTPSQMFWISAANIYCEKNHPDILELLIISDTHSPKEYRINGPMSNIPEFARDFNCLPDSAMIKKDKCQVW